MKRLSTLFLAALSSMILVTSCEQDEALLYVENEAGEIHLKKDVIARQVVDLLNEEHEAILSTVSKDPVGIKLATVLDQIENQGVTEQQTAKLRKIADESEKLYADIESAQHIEVPELWLHQPNKKINLSELLVAFPPEGNEAEWEEVKAYTLQGEVVYLDPFNAPNVPVLVVETNGFEAFKLEVDYINKKLAESSLQTPLAERKASISRSGIETTMLEKIRLNNDQEPWISGAAEIYAVTSGLNEDKDPQVRVIALPYLDHDGQDYYPNQVLLFWDDYNYQAANIQLFEKDDNYNYQEMVSIIVNGIFKITGTLTGEPWVAALGEVADAIIDVMPGSWFTNDDDYVDSYYTIEKTRTYRDHHGAGGNAKANFRPFLLQSN